MAKILKELLREKDLSFCVVQQIINPDVTEELCISGYDFIILDLEHGGKTIDAACPSIMVGAAYDVPILVRTAECSQHLIEQALDAGAQGVLVPTVETVEQARLVVNSAKFAPEGTRGWCPVTPARRWLNNCSRDEYAELANKNTYVSILIETPLGIENLPEIIKVPGIDAIMFGTGDLSLRMGKSMYDPEVAAVVQTSVEMVKNAGITCVNVGLPANISQLYQDGFHVIMSGVCDQESMRYYMMDHLGRMRDIVSKLKT